MKADIRRKRFPSMLIVDFVSRVSDAIDILLFTENAVSDGVDREPLHLAKPVVI